MATALFLLHKTERKIFCSLLRGFPMGENRPDWGLFHHNVRKLQETNVTNATVILREFA